MAGRRRKGETAEGPAVARVRANARVMSLKPGDIIEVARTRRVAGLIESGHLTEETIPDGSTTDPGPQEAAADSA